VICIGRTSYRLAPDDTNPLDAAEAPDILDCFTSRSRLGAARLRAHRCRVNHRRARLQPSVASPCDVRPNCSVPSRYCSHRSSTAASGSFQRHSMRSVCALPAAGGMHRTRCRLDAAARIRLEMQKRITIRYSRCNVNPRILLNPLVSVQHTVYIICPRHNTNGYRAHRSGHWSAYRLRMREIS